MGVNRLKKGALRELFDPDRRFLFRVGKVILSLKCNFLMKTISVREMCALHKKRRLVNTE